MFVGTQQSQVNGVGVIGSSIEPTKRQGTARQVTTTLGKRQTRASTSVMGGCRTRARITTNEALRTQMGGSQIRARPSLGARQTRSTTSLRGGSQLRAITTPQFIPPRVNSKRILHNKLSALVKGHGSSKDNDIVLE
ncbi:hypothetical protein Tco_0726605 [Tanacetum coccineum]|uniref:Uncharacterized protein n=1 Tax=Tanacetum coccineum TaxID=301880 RepID=A0ABQ4YG20_9ASTR